MRKLSELEGVCLGIVSKLHPCTAYRIRCALKEAPSSHWRASAGSVYPLLARLAEEGLVSTTSDAGDGRGRKLLKMTAKGRKSLRHWVSIAADRDLIASVTDPIRSRVFFLDALDPPRQIAFIDDLISQMESYVAETRAHLGSKSESADPYGFLGSLGASKISEARLEWLRLVRTQLSDK